MIRVKKNPMIPITTKRIYNLFLTVMAYFFILSCSTQVCQPDQLISKKTPLSDQTSTDLKAGISDMQSKIKNTDQKTIKIYKFDGSIQCEPGTGRTLSNTQSELEGIKIYSAKSAHDGVMRTQVCGNVTGQCHVFEISESDLVHAQKLGFKVWKND